MFNIGKLLTNPPKIRVERNTINVKNFLDYTSSTHNYKNYFSKEEIERSINKYDKLLSKLNEDIKRKKTIQTILYGKSLTKTTNHYVNDLINNSKYHNFIFIVSFISVGAGAFIFYKSK